MTVRVSPELMPRGCFELEQPHVKRASLCVNAMESLEQSEEKLNSFDKAHDLGVSLVGLRIWTRSVSVCWLCVALN